jgi:hypothetical protein
MRKVSQKLTESLQPLTNKFTLCQGMVQAQMDSMESAGCKYKVANPLHVT